MQINLKELTRFLVKAKKQTYAAGGKEVEPQRSGFKELMFREGDFEYRDSYAGFYLAPGQEVVRFKAVPIWAMAYSGGMSTDYRAWQLYGDEVLYITDIARKPFPGAKYSPKPTEYYENQFRKFASETFTFLKQALLQVDESKPFRGSDSFKWEDWEYINKVQGDITDFVGVEVILYKNREVFKQNYIGGLILHKI